MMPLKCGDRVSVSDISEEAAIKTDKNRYFFIGIDTIGNVVVENMDDGEYTPWRFAVPYETKKEYYIKSVDDTVTALLNHTYHFVEDRGFVCAGYDFVFGLNDWRWCNQKVASMEIAEGLGFPEWMINVIETEEAEEL